MITASLDQYLPLHDLGEILAVCLVVALIAPAAVSLAIVGLDRRAQAAEDHTSDTVGIALVAAGTLIVAALIAAGLYALFDR